MKSLKLKLYTTKRSKTNEREVKKMVDKINKSIKCARITKVDTEYIHYKKLKPVLTSKNRFSWAWFVKQFTTPAKKEGYNIVMFHCSYSHKKRWGVLRRLNGTYRNDKDGIIELWFCDRRKYARGYKPRFREFNRLFLHELLHGFYRHTYIDSKLVHTLDYKMKNLWVGYKIVDYQGIK